MGFMDDIFKNMELGVDLSEKSLQKIREMMREEVASAAARPTGVIEPDQVKNDAWLSSVRRKFRDQKPELSRLAKERHELLLWLKMFRYGLELSPAATTEEERLNQQNLLVSFDRLIKYLEDTQKTLDAFKSLAGGVSKILSEIEERS